jgi:hypothetical protein
MTATSTRQGLLGIKLIDTKTRNLAWRMFASAKLIHTDSDKIWNTADDNIKKAFNSYPPSTKAIETKKKEWAKESATTKSSPSQ